MAALSTVYVVMFTCLLMTVCSGQPFGSSYPRCRFGSTGSTCGGFAGARCPYGSYCQMIPNSDYGICCRSPIG